MIRRYFDHNATTPPAAEALDAFRRVSGDVFGNASSIHHFGQAAKQALELARQQTAALIGARQPKDIVFTSGGTEGANLAVFGVARNRGEAHVITSAIEHPAVLHACAQLEREGGAVTYLPVSGAGLVDPDDVRRALRPNTSLISVMHINNETGVIQPVEEISRIAREAGVAMHSDGVQAAGRLPVDVEALGVDLYSASAHKMYAPKGTGFLYVRAGVELTPMLYGGRHERQRRAGTENVAGAAAMGAAASLLDPARESERLTSLRDAFEQRVREAVPDIAINGERAPRAGSTSSLRIRGAGGEAAVIALDLKGFAVSSGSACSSGAVEPSHVLLAMGLSPDEARSSIRVSFGRGNTMADVEELVAALAAVASHLRRISPVYAHA